MDNLLFLIIEAFEILFAFSAGVIIGFIAKKVYNNFTASKRNNK